MRRLSAVAWGLMCVTPAACGQDDGPDLCADGKVVQLTNEELALSFRVRTVGDGDLLLLRTPENDNVLHHVRPCARSVTQVAPPGWYSSSEWLEDIEVDGAPILCRGDDQFMRIDLSGETDPEPVLSDMFCVAATDTPHGALVWDGEPDPDPGFLSTGIDPASASLWLLPEFPDPDGARQVTPTGVTSPLWTAWQAVPGALFYYAEDGMHTRDIVSGQDRAFPGEPYDLSGVGPWILMRSSDDEMQIVDGARGVVVPLASYTAADDLPEDHDATSPELSSAWRLNMTGTHVLHMPYGAPAEAFDVKGQRTTLPLTRRPFDLTLDGGALALTDVAGQMQLAYPGDLAPRLLDYPPGASIESYRVEMRDGGLEILEENGDLWFVSFDGTPLRLIARGVDTGFVWFDDRHLLTVSHGDLTTIHVPSGSRTVHARDVLSFSRASEGGFYFDVGSPVSSRQPWRSGIWYLPKSAVIPAGACHNVAGCDD